MWQGEAPLPLVMPLVLSHRARAGPAAPGSASAAACGCILTRHQTRRCQTCSTSLWTRGHGALFVMTHGATWHLHEHRRRSTHSLSTERAHRSWTLRLGNRLPACGTILAAGKNALRLRDPPQLHCWQIAWQALSSQLRLLARPKVWRGAMHHRLGAQRPLSRCLGLRVAFASRAAGSTLTHELPSGW